MKRTRWSCELLALALALTVLAGCGRSGQKHEKQLFAMDTVMLLTAYGSAGEDGLSAAADVINALAADLDPEKDASSVQALNAGAGGAVAVSADCLAVLQTALDAYALTGGALDPALYPVILAWGFTTGDYRVPGRAELDGLLAEKDTDAIAIDEAAGTVALPADMAVSLGAVAKGYAAQKAAEAMVEAGVEKAILSLGGNVQTLGDTRPDGERWQVAVTDPSDTGSYLGVLDVGQTAVVTSGGYQRYFEQNGVRYIHILDPATGMPAASGLASVTVVTADGAWADALSTALFVLGEDDALALCERCRDTERAFETVLVTDDGRVVVSSGLADRFTEAGEGYTYEYP